MFVGRIILGIGNGINTAPAPLWQTQTAQIKWRGKLVIFEIWMNVAGFSLCNWINYGMSYAGGPVAWRFPLAFQYFLFIVLFMTVPWLSLIQHGHLAEATQVLAAIDGKGIDDAFVLSQRNEIQYSVNYEREHAIG
ncbi:hypothetical protein K491DRAFT_717340 [Lophiostoma macrostomum CBS 122681]|uniref:Major facilitator superfamily (MFS) profile domain-containing protein n=1 Tax=Lophiostoma macrostomum CBS 122681 TaxID=1314788 RepID=A0A6A6T311_9PLEO|nr:hypothetical protein K491DRAFT_717340 [Lophiostoma macrostomum CBS 122681]